MNISGRLLEKFAETLVINKSACVRMRHKNAACTKCIDVCPSGAISIGKVGGRISIDWAICRDCRLCSSVCPTSVFVPRTHDRTKLYEETAEMIRKKGSVEFRCREAEKDKNGESVRVESCGAVNLSTLLWAASRGAERIHLHTGDCGECDIKLCSELFSDTAGELEKIYAEADKNLPQLSLGNAPLETTEGAETNEKPKGLKERLAASNERYSRREFMGLFKKRAKETLGETLVYINESESKSTQLSQREAAKSSRRLFVESLHKVVPEGTSIDTVGMEHLNSVEIDQDKCKTCGVCSRLCPTEALTEERDTVKGRSVCTGITVNSAYCVGCGLCKMGCFYDAVSHTDRLHL